MSKSKSKDISVFGFGFKRLGFDAFDMYTHYFRNATHEDLTFYGSFPLMMYKRYGFKVVDGFLFLFRYGRRESRKYLHSVGLPINERGERLDVESTRKCLETFTGGIGGRIIHLHPALNDRYRGLSEPRRTRSVDTEYVYGNDILANLQGGAFRNLRKNVTRVADRYDVEIFPYEKKHRQDAELIYKIWCEKEGIKYDSIWDRTLFRNLLDHHGLIDHDLYMVLDKKTGRYIGFFDAVRLSSQLAMGVMRKLDTSYGNIAKYCQVFLAQQLSQRGCSFLNDGDDAGGRPGIKKLKNAFHPISTYTPLYYKF